jgi:DHA1 family tetracycline resistance protein-like MFS transporter
VVFRASSPDTGANFTAASAYIADVSPPEKGGELRSDRGRSDWVYRRPGHWRVAGERRSAPAVLVAAGVTLLNWLYGFRRPSHWPEHRRRLTGLGNPLGSLVALKTYPVLELSRHFPDSHRAEHAARHLGAFGYRCGWTPSGGVLAIGVWRWCRVCWRGDPYRARRTALVGSGQRSAPRRW